MKISIRSMLTKKTRTFELPVTPEQYDTFKGGQAAAVCFPTLSAEQRQWLITGITTEEWAERFAKDGLELFVPEKIDIDALFVGYDLTTPTEADVVLMLPDLDIKKAA